VDPSDMLEMFLQCTLHLTLECGDTTLWPISGCITMSLPRRAESQPGTNGMKNADLNRKLGGNIFITETQTTTILPKEN